MNPDILRRICELQPHYSPTNTPEMKERGRLIRDALADELRAMLSRISEVVGDAAPDLSVDSSDGIGRKTEAPWVRVHSKSLSPNPREGYYFVIHFRADGTGVFFTVGCGSTVWNGGDLRPVSDKELSQRTGWARSVVEQRWKSVAPFTDEIQLGASAALPRTFEKATVIAKRVDFSELGRTDLDALVLEACARLGRSTAHRGIFGMFSPPSRWKQRYRLPSIPSADPPRVRASVYRGRNEKRWSFVRCFSQRSTWTVLATNAMTPRHRSRLTYLLARGTRSSR